MFHAFSMAYQASNQSISWILPVTLLQQARSRWHHMISPGVADDSFTECIPVSRIYKGIQRDNVPFIFHISNYIDYLWEDLRSLYIVSQETIFFDQHWSTTWAIFPPNNLLQKDPCHPVAIQWPALSLVSPVCVTKDLHGSCFPQCNKWVL